MKKNYAKFLLSAAIISGSLITAQAEDLVVLEENFDKLEAVTDAGVHKYGKNPWTGKDREGVEYQPNYASIVKDGNVDDLNGWSSNTTYLYACQGFVRISKTSYGGDLVSPKFTALAGMEPTDVTLSWQAIGYSSRPVYEGDTYVSGETHDYQWYAVAVLGAGKIEGAKKMGTIAYVDADKNALNVEAACLEIPSDCFITKDTLEAWGFEGTKQQLIIKGATAETQVAFMSVIPNVKTTTYSTDDMPIATDAPHNTSNKANRIILDNIKVVAQKGSLVEDINVAKEVKPRKVMENGQLYIIVDDKKFNAMGVEVK